MGEETRRALVWPLWGSRRRVEEVREVPRSGLLRCGTSVGGVALSQKVLLKKESYLEFVHELQQFREPV